MRLVCATALVLVAGCSAAPENIGVVPDGGHPAPDAAGADAGGSEDTGGILLDAGHTFFETEASPQRPGDAAAGYRALVNEGYVGCGIPASAYRAVFPAAPMSRRLPGREGPNEDLAYDFNQFVTKSGVEVVHSNCLTCHGAVINGEVILGLGDARRDFTIDPTQAAEAVGFFVQNPNERVEWRRWADRIQVTAPFIQMKTMGTNPADNLAAILFAHRDPETMAWSDTPLIEVPTTEPPPVDVPPWWRMKKKRVMFYHGAGRGDHARLMMTASVLCVDTVEEAMAIDDYFVDVRAYIAEMEAPAYPATVTATLAAEGEALFATTCARCHGVYGADASYPSLVVALEEIRTDPMLAQGASGFAAERFGEWFANSFWGETSRLDPFAGYIAPPLDGIWATGPYLHNGSVPDLFSLLDSGSRPSYWTRDFGSDTYDLDILSFPWQTSAVGHADLSAPEERRRVYDTTLPGYGNGGHTYGDAFTDEERRAVVEYLKTL